MTAALIFLLLVISVSGWWLSHQRLFSKPWLESGPDSIVEGTDRISLPKAKIGLVVFLGVVGIVFALLTSGYLMRQVNADWRTMPLPRILWLNTGLLVLGSFSLHRALRAARAHDAGSVRFWLLVAGGATLGFMVGQAVAWQQLVTNGFVLTANPANAFFYMLTGIHGLHILGGLVALGRTTASAWTDDAAATMEALRLRIDLCALYWHFLLAVWLLLLTVMLGWAHDPFFSSSH
jgi:cytochrome c oxidase subunit 3